MLINENKEYTIDQVSSDKPNVPRSENILTGYIGNSMNAGHNRTIAWKQVMAGERIKEYKIQCKIKTLTPLTPPYQQLKCTIRSYFVPNSRVWKNAEKYTAQKGGSAEIKIKEIPNLGNLTIPVIYNTDEDKETLLTNTTLWRDAFISSYLPRIGAKEVLPQGDLQEGLRLPKISVLPLRGRVAIWNDYERNKEYDTEQLEYNDDSVVSNEFLSYLPTNANKQDFINMRAKRPNNYYSNYRTEIQGFKEEYPPQNMTQFNSLITWGQWENKIAEARSEAENAQSNPWSIIAKIRGSKVALQGKVQQIGEKTFNLNYAAVTQNTYNNSENVQNENFKVLGQQGAYSYTEIEMPCFAGFEAIEEGYIHIIATVWAESVFESGIDRLELNVTPLDQYRPDLVNEKHDVLYEIECGTKINDDIDRYTVIGFKRKFSEYFKLPNIIAGDMTNQRYYNAYQAAQEDFYFDENTEIETHNTYQFFEEDRNYFKSNTGYYFKKKPWKDYSDLLVNKNLAIQEAIYENESQTGEYSLNVAGQHQIFLVGKCICINDAPIDEAIKTNYTEWGEH